jgi:tRNA (guanine-N7-)-methyltransferase
MSRSIPDERQSQMTPTDLLPKLTAHNLPWPTDWADVFGRSAPLILEIGFGRGAFLLHLARSFPDHNVIGLEISNHCLEVTEAAIARHRLPNVRVVHATAETALNHLFQPATLEQVHINFPDPWFKARHSGRRLMQRDTLDTLVSRMQPGGRLYLATDIIAYAEMSAALLADTPQLDNLLPTPWADSMPGRVITKYEATAAREGRDCYYFACQRNHQPGPDIPVLKELDMPHIVFTSPLTLDEMLAAFEPCEATLEDGTVAHIMDSYRGRHTLLFEAFAKEPTIEQRFAILLHSRPAGDYTLLVSPLGHPRATPGVHLAVLLLGSRLVKMHPDASMEDVFVRALKLND